MQRSGFPLLLLLGLSACGGAPAGAEPHASPWARADGSRAPEPERVHRRLGWIEAAGQLTVEGGSIEPPSAPGERGLRLRGGRDLRLRGPGPFEAEGWNVLALEVVAGSELWLRAGLLGAPGSAPLGSPDVPHLRAGERARVTFDLRALAEAGGPYAELLIGANGPAELAFELLAVELVARPAARWLPAVEDGPGDVALSGETRAAVALAAGAPLVARVRTARGAELALGYGPSPGTSAPAGTRLEVLARGPDGERELASLALDGPGWSDARVALPATPAELELVARLAGAGPETALALEPPLAFVPRADAATVLLVTSDTHRGDHLGASERNVGVRTSVLDALARRGVVFEDCLSSSNVTVPSHAALLTGRTPRDTGVVDNRTPLAEGCGTLAERFRAAGWATFGATSTKLLAPRWSGLGRGFERLSAPEQELSRPGSETLDVLERWLRSCVGRPLFAWVHVYEAHRPYAPPEGYAEAYYPSGRDPYDPGQELGGPPVPGSPGVRDRAWIDALYRGEVSYVDSLVGRLLAHERLASGVVAFTADHGECLGEQGLWWDHLAAYPAVLHVPLVLAWPGAPGGERVRAGVRQIDVGATLLALAGVEAGDFPGADLRRWLAQPPAADEPRFAVADEGQAVALTEGPWHLIVHLAAPDKPNLVTRDLLASPVELFDRARDPGCALDRRAEEPERMRAMARRLYQWARAAPPVARRTHELDEESRAMLSGLGYGTGAEGEPAGFVDVELLAERLAPYLD